LGDPFSTGIRQKSMSIEINMCLQKKIATKRDKQSKDGKILDLVYTLYELEGMTEKVISKWAYFRGTCVNILHTHLHMVHP
jgi:hypothetical protein